jgi:hypothetical protein
LSRLRSAPARGSGSTARPAPGRQVMVPTAKSDIYVAMLGVALASMILGCLLLVLVLNRYEFQTKVSARLATGPDSPTLAALEKNPEFRGSVRL